jgi:hypothetical protein
MCAPPPVVCGPGARFSEKLDPRVVVGEHGWWQGCDDLGVDPFDPNGTNFNLKVDASVRDSVSGTPSPSLRSSADAGISRRTTLGNGRFNFSDGQVMVRDWRSNFANGTPGLPATRFVG